MAKTKLKKHIKCGECGEAIDAVNGVYIWDYARQAFVDTSCFVKEGSSDAVDSGNVVENIARLINTAAEGLRGIAKDYDPEHAVHMEDQLRGDIHRFTLACDDLTLVNMRLEEDGKRPTRKSRKNGGK